MLESVNITRAWKAKWIGTGFDHSSWYAKSQPAPFFRKTFQYNGGKSKAFICGLGYYVLYINGKRVGDHVLDPVVSRYDMRSRYVEYDVTSYLKKGENTIGVVLGSGWYNCQTAEVWHFDKAPWQDDPKLIFELEVSGKAIVKSDTSWRWFRNGPFQFEQLRNGEFYDARLEVPGWNNNGFDDSEWGKVKIVPGPGGLLNKQIMPPCKVRETVPAKKVFTAPDGADVYEMEKAITGWCRITVKGEPGATVKLHYSELIKDKDINPGNVVCFIKSGEGQTDCYTLKGGKAETWEPSFTYHGFHYVKAVITGKAKIVSLEGRFVSTSFEDVSHFESSDKMLNKLFDVTRHTYCTNFTGIPTDCPHREKNGWTGDAFLACETGYFVCNPAEAYAEWMQVFRDVQRPNGQLPGIVPTGGWGFNWGSGPAWDGAFIMIPWYTYVFTGDDSVIRDCYDRMVLYMGYLDSIAENDIVKFGLGDWCPPDWKRMVDCSLIVTGYYYMFARQIAKYAGMLGKDKDQKYFTKLAGQIAKAFNREFYKGNGVYAKGEITAEACALYHGLVPAAERKAVEQKLIKAVEKAKCTANFGIMGAKYTPRVLAEIGRSDLALRMITQDAEPGWAHWIKLGATTLRENWNSDASQDHIMFGDIAAWMMQYCAGIKPDETHAGFSFLTLKPEWNCGLKSVKADYRIEKGVIKIEWKKTSKGFSFRAELPKGLNGRVILPDGSEKSLVCGKNDLKF